MGSSIFSVATILVLANFILICSAESFYDDGDLSSNIILLTEFDSLLDNGTAIYDEDATHYAGDLVVGTHHPYEIKVWGEHAVSNPSSQVSHSKIKLVSQRGIFHFVRVQNTPGSRLVACATRETLGSRVSIISARIDPYAYAKVKFYGAVRN